MDLTYMDNNGIEKGALLNYELDIDLGGDNKFEIALSINENILNYDYMFYMEGTEFGGIIDSISVDTAKKKITYGGRSWRGILEKKIIQPYSGQDYYIISGNAKDVLNTIITDIGLEDLFYVDSSEITIKTFQAERYDNAYNIISKMLAQNSARMKLYYKNKYVHIAAVDIQDLSTEEQYDNGNVEFIMMKNKNAVNHMVGLGKGDLKERQVVHRYVDNSGNVKNYQTFFGKNEVTETYENTSVESLEKLEEETEEKLLERHIESKMEMSISSTDIDIGDIVGGKEYITGMEIKKQVSRKIVKATQEYIKVTYEVGD